LAAAQTRHALIHELKALTRDQEALIQSLTRLVNHPTASLKAYYSAALKLFTKLQQHCALMCLQTYPTPQPLKRLQLRRSRPSRERGIIAIPPKLQNRLGRPSTNRIS
jgi:hypothetical protein